MVELTAVALAERAGFLEASYWTWRTFLARAPGRAIPAHGNADRHDFVHDRGRRQAGMVRQLHAKPAFADRLLTLDDHRPFVTSIRRDPSHRFLDPTSNDLDADLLVANDLEIRERLRRP
jgi:hypothetical protein